MSSLSEQRTVKIVFRDFHDEISRIALVVPLNIERLQTELRQLFAAKSAIDKKDVILDKITYVDEDGDTITVTSTRELEEAGRVADIQKLALKLFVTTKNKLPSNFEAKKVEDEDSNFEAKKVEDEDVAISSAPGAPISSTESSSSNSSNASNLSDAATGTPRSFDQDGDDFHIVSAGDIQQNANVSSATAPVPISIPDDSNVDAKVWAGYFDFSSGRTYWYNKKTGITTWNTPNGPSRDDSQSASSPKRAVAWIHPMKGASSSLLDQIRLGKKLRKVGKRGCRGHGGWGGHRFGKRGRHCHGQQGRGHPWGHHGHGRRHGHGHGHGHWRNLRQQINSEIVEASSALSGSDRRKEESSKTKKQRPVDDDEEVSWDRVHLLALQLLGSPAARNKISEIKSCLQPPQLVKDSLHATCILFDMEDPSNLKTMKQLLVTKKNTVCPQGLFQRMVRLDPASLTKDKLDRLAPLLTCAPEDSKKATVAIEPLYTWLHAVYTYGIQKLSKPVQAVSPRQSLLKEIQSKDFKLKQVTDSPQERVNLMDELHKMKIVHESHTQEALSQARRQLRQEVRSMQGELSAKRCLLRELRSAVSEKQNGRGKHNGGKHFGGKHNGGKHKGGKHNEGKPKHLNIQCDGCGILHIPNVRFKCVVCPDFDLCGQCERSGMHDPSHPMLKMKVHVEDFAVSYQPKIQCVQIPPVPAVPAEGPVLAAVPISPPPPPPKPMKLPGDQLPMATIVALPPFQYAAQLQSIKDMGFNDNDATLKSLLLHHKGNVESVVHALV